MDTLLTVVFGVWAASATAGLFVLFLKYREMANNATKDFLTSLLNRRGFVERATPYIEGIASSQGGKVRRSILGGGFSVVIVDLDHFKAVNDIYGHGRGDEVLQTVSRLLLGAARKFDLVARWGGEEFLLGLVGAGEDEALAVAERLRKKVATTPIRNGEIKLTISAGVATFVASRDRDLAGLVERADEALCQAKRRGRNCCVVAS